ncbi:methyltransferase [Streptomyces sp. NPDC093600]|uniref:methyltransferase n=1 Tax=Streptomyces sp. NPDC093600 TaxID=3366047 RepID=UPI003812EF09
MITAHQGGHAALVENLYERGLLDSTWRDVWLAVPRGDFIPDRIWRQAPDRCVPVTDPAEREQLIASDEPIVIQLDDGAAEGPGIATSSNSMPSMVARSIALLDIEDGHKVGEIGTASGHVAALLSERLGSERVYSSEIDPALARLAAANLRSAGYAPHLSCSDGEWGWPNAAPFDSILATCALRHVPHQLVRQIRPHGRLVAPMARDFWSGALVQLVVDEHGVASGHFHSGASYMPMRSHRVGDGAPVDSSTARQRQSAVEPHELLRLDFALYAGARLPGVRMWHTEDRGTVQVWAQDRRGSAAMAATGGEVWEYGPRSLWQAIERAYDEYTDLGSPGAEQCGLTVRAGGESFWVMYPTRIIEPMPHIDPELRPARGFLVP